ncbi:two-component sensor histidine kinase [Nocardioides daphniae]|uniref:Two-component sensor histidine kinase n=1 Tax=Nocardioides daphniae TaxID=402297 RepID=A0ABQ1QFS0_9ACTN|nr:two-component sensor histidine kinase [Nocardioides daphniae]
MLALVGVLVLNASDGTWPGTGGTAAVLGLAALFVVTYVVGVWPAGALPRGRRGWWWTTALTLEWLVLLTLSADATYLVFALFFIYMHLLGTTRGVAAVILAAVVAVIAFGIHRGFDAAGVVGPALGAGVAVVIGLGYDALTRDVTRRQALIDELTHTRDQLAAVEREAGVVAERERLAREIHDTVSQSLSSIVMLLHVAQREGTDTDKGRERVEQARVAAGEALAETRNFIHALAPPSLRVGGIADALQRLGATTQQTSGLRTRVDVSGYVGDLPTPVETALLRIAQSAVANVVQHARAARVDVTLSRLDDEVILDVVDDGVGFDLAALSRSSRTDQQSFGLVAMQDRAVALGGRLVVESGRGQGTSVAASFTVHPGKGLDKGLAQEHRFDHGGTR